MEDSLLSQQDMCVGDLSNTTPSDSTVQPLITDQLFHRKGVPDAELVYSSEANVRIPQMVIKFYESKLTWHDVSELMAGEL